MHSGNCNMFQGRRKHYSRCFVWFCRNESLWASLIFWYWEGCGSWVWIEAESSGAQDWLHRSSWRVKAYVFIVSIWDCSNWCKREETAWQSVSSQKYPKNEICFATWHSDVVIAGSDWVFSNVPHCCLISWAEVQQKSAREKHHLRNQKHTTKSTKIIIPRLLKSRPQLLTPVAYSCLTPEAERQNTTNANPKHSTKSSRIANLWIWQDLTISRFVDLHVLTCCSSTFTVCTGRLRRLCLNANWPNPNLAAFGEILSLSGLVSRCPFSIRMSGCCSWSSLRSLSFCHKQHNLVGIYLSQ